MSKKYHMALFNFHFNPLLASRHGRDNKIHTTQISCKFHIAIFVDQRGLFIYKGWLWIHSYPFKHLRSVARFFALHWLVTRLVPFFSDQKKWKGCCLHNSILFSLFHKSAFKLGCSGNKKKCPHFFPPIFQFSPLLFFWVDISRGWVTGFGQGK